MLPELFDWSIMVGCVSNAAATARLANIYLCAREVDVLHDSETLLGKALLNEP